jgi:ferritin-like protein
MRTQSRMPRSSSFFGEERPRAVEEVVKFSACRRPRAGATQVEIPSILNPLVLVETTS